jgi:phosphate transport system permease protein
MAAIYLLCTAGLAVLSFFLAASRARALATTGAALHSRPSYHGLFLASLVLTAAFAIFALGWPLTGWLAEKYALSVLPAHVTADPVGRDTALRDIGEIVQGREVAGANSEIIGAAAAYARITWLGRVITLIAGLAAAAALLLNGWNRISSYFPARNYFERWVEYLVFACAAVAVLTTVGIVFSVVFETLRFFQLVSPVDFLFGLEWNPQTALRADQGEFGGSFGIVPLITGTLLITTIAILVAGPIGLTAAIFMSEYASSRTRAFVKPMLEILAGIPTVVLGFFAALTVAPFIRNIGTAVGLSVASESALAAGLVMGVMIIPFVSSLSDDVMNAVPQSLRDGSYAMGSTRSETIKKVVLPAALPGIVSAFMLAISRAIGETMIVVMAAGLAANLTFNPLAAVTTFTVQIKTILVGDQEFDSAKTLSAFALGFVLFFLTLALNVLALRIVRRYRERYD